jgi:NADH-quinone oxidoreductase subunit G
MRPSLWSDAIARHAPILQFLRPEQTAEISPADADRLGLHAGEVVRVGANGTRVNATVEVRAGMPEGTVYLVDGADDQPANALLHGEQVEVEPA